LKSVKVLWVKTGLTKWADIELVSSLNYETELRVFTSSCLSFLLKLYSDLKYFSKKFYLYIFSEFYGSLTLDIPKLLLKISAWFYLFVDSNDFRYVKNSFC